MRAHPINLHRPPRDVLAGWPRDRPLAALWSGDPPASRWCIFAAPARVVPNAEAMERLSEVLPAGSSEQIPFSGGLIGWISYDFGRVLEPRAQGSGRGSDDRRWPQMVWLECPDGVVFDHQTSRWWSFGNGAALVESLPGDSCGGLRVGPLTSRTGRDEYIAGVARVLEYIRAGDAYQINLAHRLSARFEGSGRALWRALLEAAAPRFGAYLESDVGNQRLVLAGASPELFLEFDPATRRLMTRPMKGTRPSRRGARQDLITSPKDRAELAMIVDLMRNDLGRVCELGSVRVEEARALEEHGGSDHSSRRLLQTTALVSGLVRPGSSVMDVLRATFPGGSVTGAPKIRAMQIIDELEPVPRGPYCGAAGYVCDSGRFAFNVLIRSALLSGTPTEPGELAGVLDYSVGAGIVAESDPESEWLETLDKAAVLRAAIRMGAARVRDGAKRAARTR